MGNRHHPVKAGQQLGGGFLPNGDLMAMAFPVQPGLAVSAIRAHEVARGDGFADGLLPCFQASQPSGEEGDSCRM